MKASSYTILTKMVSNVAVFGCLIAAVTAGSLYLYVYRSIEAQQIDGLEAYIQQRGAYEETIFTLAERNHEIAKNEVIQRLRSLGDEDPSDRFDSLFERQTDGITRNREAIFDGTKMAGVYVDEDLRIDADIRRRVLTFYDVCNTFGPAWHASFQDTYITTPENIMVIYWPEVPRWCQDANTTLYMPDEEYVYVADAKHNPERKTVWTGLFYDHVASVWMVSCETPIYDADRHIATIGHDIVLNELFDRVINQRLEGTYNLVLREDGRLIAHPDLIEEIKTKEGYFDIHESSNEYLMDLLRTVRSFVDQRAFVVKHPSGEDYLAVAYMETIGWYFVTVYPTRMLTAVASGTATTSISVAIFTLLLLSVLLYFLMKKYVGSPLQVLTTAAHKIEAGDYDTIIDLRGQDEMGILGQAFSRMVSGIRDRDRRLAESARDLEHRVLESTAELRQMVAASEEKASEEASLARLTSRLQGKLEVEEVAEHVLAAITEFIGAPSGALFVLDDDNLLQRAAAHALSPDAESLTSFAIGIGSVGQAARSRQLAVQAHPEGTNAITFGFGSASPPQIVTSPLVSSDELAGVVELLLLEAITEEQVRWLEKACEIAATSLRFAQETREREEAEGALRESERRMSQIINFLPDATLVIDLDGRVVFWNRKLEEMTGVKAEEILGKGDYEYAIPFYGERRPILIDIALKPRPESDEVYNRVSRNGDIVSGETYVPNIKSKDGEEAYLQGMATPLYDSDGEIIGAIECILDITDRKQAEEELKEAKKLAEEAVRSRPTSS